MQPTISIVITVYNRSHYLRNAIESVLNQTHRNFELVIWDDASTDNSLEIAHEYAQKDNRIRVIAANKNTGFPTAIKTAVEATTGDYIGWVDSDDMLAPTAIEETSSILNNHPQVGLVYTDYELMNSQGKLRGLGNRCRIPYSKEGLLVDLMTFHFRLIRRSVYDAVGGVDDSFESGEDYDLCLKLSEVTEVYHIAKPLYYYRRHSDNVSNDNFKNIYWSQKAINDALFRRGLNEDYELDTHLTAFFSIKPKLKKKTIINNQHQTDLPLQAIRKVKNDGNKFPLVSIIIPCYNPSMMLERCLNSCFEQTYPNIEIIIVDNNSTDGSIEVAHKLAANSSYPVIFTNCYTQGQNNAFNHGFTYSTGDYIQWLDADDELMPDKIKLQVAALEQNPEKDIAYGDWEYCFYKSLVKKGNNPFHIIPQPKCEYRFGFTSQQYEDYLLQTLSHNWQPPLSYLLRRDSAIKLQEFSAWNPQTFLATDREYYTIAAIIGLRFLYVKDALVRYNFWSPIQNSRKTSDKGRTKCYKKMYQRFQTIAAQQPLQRFTKQHWFLLKQNWDLWKLAPVTLIQKADNIFLIDNQTQFGINITPSQAKIVSALNKINTACTLENHASWIVHLMAQRIALLPEIDSYEKLAEELSRWVGIKYCSKHDKLTWKYPFQTEDNKEQLKKLINTIPWFAPIFEQQRLAVFYALDKLRNARMLVKDTQLESTFSILR
ncbi:filamentous hemagglutinin outer membrane protein (plasmid) [Calothrix parasitica NIES-267]|uniref:Filamentous hemagglutinin outer membrane protein n=1 Tax=Calothrix parasitica NIES-267 TaxID=1973488 RepID=A0A1Z4M2R3_9CYAN|nr:filamentous hemagglutinin outer membrane protein [Calothrix parasitica NIES-267]